MPLADVTPLLPTQAVQTGELRLIPADPFNKIWDHWLGNPQDWCISRQLWWGHRIPAYHVIVKGRPSDVRPGQIRSLGRMGAPG